MDLCLRINKLLAATLACSVVLTVVLSCKGKNDSSTTYEREYHVDWQHGFQEGLGEVEVNGKWGFINSAGEIVIEPKFNQVFGFHEGIATARSGAIWDKRKAAFLGLAGRWIHINKKGDPAYKKSNFHVSPDGFSEGLAAVWLAERKSTGFWTYIVEEKWGFINMKGEIVIPVKYHDVRFPFSEGLAAFEDPNLKDGYINHAGEVVIEPCYVLALEFSEGRAAVKKKEGWGFINKHGDVVIPLQYDSARSFSEDLAAIKKNEKWGAINKQGEVMISFEYDYIRSFSEGLAAVKKNDKWGYIEKNGQVVIPFKFDDAETFSDGLAPVEVGGKWGYINKKGDFVIEPKFYLASPFTEGFAKVAVGDKLGYIDKQGKYIWEPTR